MADRNSAGLARRVTARFLDLVVVLFPTVVMLSALGVPQESATAIVTFPILHIAYHVTFEFNTGATLGKRVMGLGVTTTDGDLLEPPDAVRRNAFVLLQIFAGPPLLVLFATLTWSAFAIVVATSVVQRPDRRGIHDRWSEAVVRRRRRTYRR